MRLSDDVRSQLGLHIPQHLLSLEVPPDPALGDYAVPCFALAKEWKKAPQQIASELAETPVEAPIARLVANGPYLNVFLDRAWLASAVLAAPALGAEEKGQTILFEYPSPNTNKPLHLGHLRNMLLGAASANVCEAAGYRVIRTNLYNDRGIHICKSMLAYMRWGENRTPESMDMKPDAFVGHWYVTFAQQAKEHPELEAEAQELLRQWESGDETVRALWEQMNSWALKGHGQTYSRLGITHDATYYESAFYDRAKERVLAARKEGLLALDEKENIIADLSDEGLGHKVVLRADGTSVYMTQDIALAQIRQEEHSPEAQVYVLGEEQKHHFRQLQAILTKLGLPHAERLYNLWYGLISLPSGRMKSREGVVVDIDEFLDELEGLAAIKIEERHEDLEAAALYERAVALAHGAVKFFILKYEPKTSFTYDPSESLSFEGETGPYIQYAVARINSILREEAAGDFEADKLVEDEEAQLLALLGRSQEVVEEAADAYKPHLVARHAMAVAQSFTAFYHAHKVLDERPAVRRARLALIAKAKEHLTALLGLLGIDAPEEM